MLGSNNEGLKITKQTMPRPYASINGGQVKGKKKGGRGANLDGGIPCARALVTPPPLNTTSGLVRPGGGGIFFFFFFFF